ncbi:hypothetical protein ACFQU7_37720 [Pseudoroseomonas wenyumeiae]
MTPDPAARHEPFPLTEIQQAYWLGRDTGFELGNVATHGYLEADCLGLDLPRFEQAWQRLVERHDMLRMVVLPGGMQQVRPGRALSHRGAGPARLPRPGRRRRWRTGARFCRTSCWTRRKGRSSTCAPRCWTGISPACT